MLLFHETPPETIFLGPRRISIGWICPRVVFHKQGEAHFTSVIFITTIKYHEQPYPANQVDVRSHQVPYHLLLCTLINAFFVSGQLLLIIISLL